MEDFTQKTEKVSNKQSQRNGTKGESQAETEENQTEAVSMNSL